MTESLYGRLIALEFVKIPDMFNATSVHGILMLSRPGKSVEVE